MELLKTSNLKNKAVFVARKYGGVKLGSERFQCYIQAATSALTRDSYNTVLKISQEVTSTNQRPSYRENKQQSFQQPFQTPYPVYGDLVAPEPRPSQPSYQNKSKATTYRPYNRGVRSRPYQGFARRGQQQPIRGAYMSTQNYNAFRNQGELFPTQYSGFAFSKPWNAGANAASAANGSDLN